MEFWESESCVSLLLFYHKKGKARKEKWTDTAVVLEMVNMVCMILVMINYRSSGTICK